MRQTLALVNYYGRRYDRAIADGRAPRARATAGACATSRGPLARRARPRHRSGAHVQRPGRDHPEELAVLAIACSRSGDDARAAAIVKDLTTRDPSPLAALARWYAATGDVNRAIAAFEQMAARRPGALQRSRTIRRSNA